jgi:general secretion pathway protein A
MEYYKLLHLEKEPFSNSPDPDFFYASRQHLSCLQKLELSIRLTRGLAVVLADVGTGKTTMCRQLIRRLAQDQRVETHLLLDPEAGSGLEFLSVIARMCAGRADTPEKTERELKEMLKTYLFRRAVEEGCTVVLIIDEGQKLAPFSVEILRELLNFETNEKKLLQIVIFAQSEFEETLSNHPNFADRASLYERILPLGFKETRSMVRHRLSEAGAKNPGAYFTLPGFWAVWQYSGGYPRKIVELCHRALLGLIIQDRHRVGFSLARASSRRGKVPEPRIGSAWTAALVCALAFVAVLGALSVGGGLRQAPDGPVQAALGTSPGTESQVPAVLAAKSRETFQPDSAAAPGPSGQGATEGAVPAPVSAAPVPGETINAASAAQTPPDGEAAAPENGLHLIETWGGREGGHGRIILFFSGPVAAKGLGKTGDTAAFVVPGAVSRLAAYRSYKSFPGWLAMENQDGQLLVRVGTSARLREVRPVEDPDTSRLVLDVVYQ